MPISSYRYTTLVSSSTPTLVQSFTTTTQTAGIGGESGNNFAITLPNPVGLHNCLVFQVSYPSGNTVSSISDTNNGSWSITPAATVTGSAMINSIFVFPNSSAGQDTITFTLNAATGPVKMRFMEWRNIALSNPVNAHSSSSTQTNSGSGISCGSLSPSSNSLVLAFFDADTTQASSNPTSWSAGGSFSLHDADIAWSDNVGYPAASQYLVTSSSVNPTITPNGDTTDAFNCLAVSLTGASAGTAPSTKIRIVKIVQFAIHDLTTTTWKLQSALTGNLGVFAVPFSTGNVNYTSLVDNNSNTWTSPLTSGGLVQIFYLPNATVNNHLIATLTSAAAFNNPAGFWFYDIANAATNPIGQFAQAGPVSVGTGTSVSDQPDLPAPTAGSLILAWLNNFFGPTTSVTSPSGVIFDNVGYNTEHDFGFLNFGNGLVHLNNAPATSEAWDWTFSSQSGNQVGGTAIEFKSA